MRARTVLTAMVIWAAAAAFSLPAVYAQGKDNPDAARKAFLRACKVFMHPRCVNCHPRGDRPLQGDDSHPHSMHVVRGPEGLGKNGLLCSTCHQEENLPGAHMPPGALGWELPPANMPMVFEKITPRVLCEHLKDPAQNGRRSPEELIEHVNSTPIVLWGWDPGEGRTPVPVPHDEFVKDVREWVENGAACPE
jgi:mono/diheme cytochrome c family protein